MGSIATGCFVCQNIYRFKKWLDNPWKKGPLRATKQEDADVTSSSGSPQAADCQELCKLLGERAESLSFCICYWSLLSGEEGAKQRLFFAGVVACSWWHTIFWNLCLRILKLKEELNFIFFVPAACLFHVFRSVLVMKLDRSVPIQLQCVQFSSSPVLPKLYRVYSWTVLPNQSKETTKNTWNKTERWGYFYSCWVLDRSSTNGYIWNVSGWFRFIVSILTQRLF